MQSLPPELVVKIADTSPSARLSLSGTSESLGNVLGEGVVLPRGYVVPWNEFVRSGVRSVRGEGSVRLPSDNRMLRASRRTRGNLQLEMEEDDSWPRDLFVCAKVRVLLYPQSRFRVTVGHLSQPPTGVEWYDGSLSIGLWKKQWRMVPSKLFEDFLAVVPLRRFYIYVPEFGHTKKKDLEPLIHTLSTIPTLETIVLHIEYRVYKGLLPPNVWRLEIRGLSFEERSALPVWPGIREIVLRWPRFPPTSDLLADFNATFRNLLNLQHLIFQLRPWEMNLSGFIQEIRRGRSDLTVEIQKIPDDNDET